MNEIDARIEAQTPGRKGVGGREKRKAIWNGEPTNNLKRKAPVKIIEERMQRLRTSRMDTRLWTPALRIKRVGGCETKTTWDGKNDIVGKELRIALEKDKEGQMTP